MSLPDGKRRYLKWHMWHYVGRSEWNPSRDFKVPRYWSWPVTESALPSRIWRPDKVDYLASLTPLVFFFFISVCWAITKRTEEFEHLPVGLTRLISSTTCHFRHYQNESSLLKSFIFVLTIRLLCCCMAALHSQLQNFPDTPRMAPAELWRSDLKDYSSWQSVCRPADL